MAELDLTNPEHLAELLRTTLPGFDEESPERVAPHVEALERSDADVFGHVGTGERIDDDAPVEQGEPDVEQQAPDEQLEQAEPPVEQAEPPVEQSEPDIEQQAPDEQLEQLDPKQQQPDLPHGQVEQLPLDMGGEGELVCDGAEAELAGVPVRARRGWTEIDRYQSKGVHEVYVLHARHQRSKPIHSAFTGKCQSVRVSLPPEPPSADGFIGTWIGTVETKDHLAFSVREVCDYYERTFGERPKLTRVDLITGARFRGRRFSPVSVYLGYVSSAADAKPMVYMLEGGSAQGEPKAMYVSRMLESEVKVQSDFRFTPFACNTNWYEGGLAMSRDRSEPACVYLTVSQARDGRNEYLKISVDYERDREMRRVVHPFELQIEAALRVMAIAEESGCELRDGSGGRLQHSMGPIVRALMPWDEKPHGSSTPLERRQFCGCPKN